MKIKSTPGPWRVEPDGSIVGPDGCDVIASHADYLGGNYLAATEEDRRLIAAAPDLLEALEGLTKGFDGVAYSAWTSEMHAAVAAIAKAKGERI